MKEDSDKLSDAATLTGDEGEMEEEAGPSSSAEEGAASGDVRPVSSSPDDDHNNNNNAEATMDDQIDVTSGDLSFDDLTEVLANILGCLCVNEIMRSRGVNKKWKEAVKMTIVPLNTDFVTFFVYDLESYNAMRVMTRALPNLQQIKLCDFDDGRIQRHESESDEYDSDSESVDPDNRQHKWSDGEDPHGGQAARTSDWISHDIEILSNFSKLRELRISCQYDLNGRYPVLFNFPLLQKLNIFECHYLKWDLEMLAGLPVLKELTCTGNYYLTGNISSLRVLNNTLELVKIFYCRNVEGNFMDLADFPHLKELDLRTTAVTGDIRDIGDNNFSSLEQLDLPKGVYGGRGHELQRISDAPDLVRAVYLFNKQRPTLKINNRWYAVLSEDSPDRYASVDDGETPPFFIGFVQAGSRVGYRWETNIERPCEINWLDSEPATGSSDYEKYTEELQKIEGEVTMYRGLHEPPTEEEYLRLWTE